MTTAQTKELPARGVPQANTVTKSRDVVAVACKLPNGIILRAFVPNQEQELVLGGGSRDVTVYRETEDRFVVGGTAARVGDPPPILVEGGYRITTVPKPLWDAWYEANKNSDLVKNRLIYAAEKEEDARAFSLDNDGTLSGLEALDPTAPGKRVRGIEPGGKPR